MISLSSRSGSIGPAEFIGEGVYAAEGVAPSGEVVYFGMETIEERDKHKWIEYKDTAALLACGGNSRSSIGSLVQIGSRINNEIALKEFLATCRYPDYWTSDKLKFESLKLKLNERQIRVGSPKVREIAAISQASSGFNLNSQTHVVYVSKSPIVGRINFGSKLMNFDGYIENYSGLVMSVGSTVNECVENRGIFRNPLSVVDGGYSGVAMMLHSFTCRVVGNNPEIKVFKVRPMQRMGEIFFNTLPKEEITVNGIRGDLYDKGFEFEQNVQVPVKILAELYN